MVNKLLLLSIVVFAVVVFALAYWGVGIKAFAEEANVSAELEQAEEYEDAGKYEQAEAIYKATVQDYPGSDYPRRLRRTGCACGSCENDCISVGDVAINSGNVDLECGETVCVHQHGTHKVRDTGGLAMDQLDHYYGVSDCDDCPSIGDNIMTIKLY